MASLCEEDEELAPAATASAVAAPPARIDAFAALCNKEGQWGDLAVFGDLVAAPARRGYVQRADGTWRDLDAPCLTLADLFAQPFATRLGQEDEEDYSDMPGLIPMDECENYNHISEIQHHYPTRQAVRTHHMFLD
jgi:hypothetical protein